MLCHNCTRIEEALVTGISTWLADRRRFTWRGKMVMTVGHYYRQIPASTTCSLCRQLRAPWILPFLNRLHEDVNLSDDKIMRYYNEPDRIHIFRNMRLLPHVNDYPTSRNMLKEHDAPYHIAVVPNAGRKSWKEELQAHISEQGIVAIFPRDHPQSRGEIFEMREVNPWFKPAVVQRSLATCRDHITLCNPRKPDVKGMRVINCWSDDLWIDEYDGDQDYVALSYVWGAPGRTEEEPTRADHSVTHTSTNANSASHSMAAAQFRSPKGKSVRNLNVRQSRRHAPYRSPPARTAANNNVHNTRSSPIRHPSRAESHAITVTRRPGSNPLLKLPANIPGTIRDAIVVAKQLHIKYLWVDQYCIDQSADQAAKQEQFSRMADIYGGARVTIFALGSHSDSGLPGVSLPRASWREHRTVLGAQEQQYTLISTLPDPQAIIEASTWATRAWTYQESLFSTRRLFFTPHQVYFECNAMNVTESLRSRMRILHVRSRQRLLAFHRAGRFVCGNSNSFSHLNVRAADKCHRKIDVVRRAQVHTRAYTRREMTDSGDVLNAFAGVAEYYARSAAMIASLAGLAVPAPIARAGRTRGLGTRSLSEEEGLDHLSYALAWSHELHTMTRDESLTNPKGLPASLRRSLPWSPRDNPMPRRRQTTSDGRRFPSWSWAGWCGEMASRHEDLPHCYTSLIGLGSVVLHFRDGPRRNAATRQLPVSGEASSSRSVPRQAPVRPMNYTFLLDRQQYMKYLIDRLLTTTEIHLDAFLLNSARLRPWERSPARPYHGARDRNDGTSTLNVRMSEGPAEWSQIYEQLVDGRLLCLVLGTYGEPRERVIRAMRDSDGKSDTARMGRIDLIERWEPDSIVCLVVKRVKARGSGQSGASSSSSSSSSDERIMVERKGLLKIEFRGLETVETVTIRKRLRHRTKRCSWQQWMAEGGRRKFALV
ncbi:heterokaryon incompatibility protein-domain-containing protein [Microdochium bolleyi]|uniref:Heterokaryon incompatibility protein-domain-containing protein n=1 Tax=Microdochium bolleyi TaxID=196109 RepID=A0A136IQ40_9PEZI|nr:heterokaryon incompatibility protein-domain-containing protein [Microdochium bolleyi]